MSELTITLASAKKAFKNDAAKSGLWTTRAAHSLATWIIAWQDTNGHDVKSRDEFLAEYETLPGAVDVWSINTARQYWAAIRKIHVRGELSYVDILALGESARELKARADAIKVNKSRNADDNADDNAPTLDELDDDNKDERDDLDDPTLDDMEDSAPTGTHRDRIAAAIDLIAELEDCGNRDALAKLAVTAYDAAKRIPETGPRANRGSTGSTASAASKRMSRAAG